MSFITKVMKFFKKDPATDGLTNFDLQTMLNDNLDKLEALALSSWHPTIADLTALKAIPIDEIGDGAIIPVKSLGLYKYDATDATAGDDNLTVVPTFGVGRYKKIASPEVYTTYATTVIAGLVQLATTAEATTGTDTTKAVTPAGVKAVITALVGATPALLDTLDELAAALGDDPNFATTMANALAGKAASVHNHDASAINAGTLSIPRGGTGATTAAGILLAAGLTATAAELNRLAGLAAGLTVTEINYLDGVTSAIQAQLDARLKLAGGGTMTSGEFNMADFLLTRPYIKDYSEVVGTTPATTGTCTFDLTTGNVFKVTPTGAITIGAANPPITGRGGSATIWLTNGATVYAKTFAAAIKWVGDEIPDMSEANKTYGIVLTTLNGGTAYRAACVGPYSA